MHLNIIPGFLAGLLLTGLLSCQHSPDPHLLVDQHCSRCHMAPDPAAIPKGIWESHVLPHMAARLGIYGEEGSGFTREDMLGQPSEVAFSSPLFPEHAILGQEEWNTLSEWILDQAPETLPTSDFSLSEQPFPSAFHSIPTVSATPATTSLLRLSDGTFSISEATSGTLSLWNGEDESVSAIVGEGALSIHELTDALLFPVMGEFSPHQDPKGYLLALPANQEIAPVKLIDQLHRPVHLSVADVNDDGFQDFVICEFGKWVGRLSLWMNDGSNRQYNPTTLWNEPGATQTIVTDVDQDGDQDIIALFAQAREGIYCFRQTNGTFQMEPWLEFPAHYGCSGFIYEDMDQDGKPELLVTMGDNADYPPVTKPYHGIRKYALTGEGWIEELFIPFPGAYRAIPLDVDLDGTLEIAAISFFPDPLYSLPQSAGIFDEENGEWIFHPFEGQEKGRWQTLEVEDLDSDGDPDFLLGSLLFDAPDRPDWVQRWKVENAGAAWIENLTIQGER